MDTRTLEMAFEGAVASGNFEDAYAIEKELEEARRSDFTSMGKAEEPTNPLQRVWGYINDPAAQEEMATTGRGIAGGINSATAGAIGAVAESAAGLSDLINPFEQYTGSARATVKPLVEELRDAQALERDIGIENRPEGFGTGLAYDAVTAVGQMLPTMATFYFTRNPNAALSVMGSQVAGATYEEKKHEGWSTADALGEAVKQGAYEIGPEKMFKVFDKMGGLTTVKKILSTAAAESGSEATTELFNILEESINKSESFPEFWDKLISIDSAKRTGYAALLGSLLGVGMGAPGFVRNSQLQREMDAEEETRAGWVAQNFEYQRQMDQIRLEEEEAAERAEAEGQAELSRRVDAEGARARAAEVVERIVHSPNFTYEGTGTTSLQPQEVPLSGVSGLETREQAPSVVEESPQTELELLGRFRTPGERYDPQNVPAVGTAMADEVLNLDASPPEELFNVARNYVQTSDTPEPSPGIRQRALDEIDSLEDDYVLGTEETKAQAAREIRQLVRTMIDSQDFTSRVEDRLRLRPLERDVEEAPLIEEAPQLSGVDTPAITEEGRAFAARAPIKHEGSRGTFELVSIEAETGIVHVRWTGKPTKRSGKAVGEGQQAYMEAYWNIADPRDTLTIVDQLGTDKTKVPVEFRREVNKAASQLVRGFDQTTSARFRANVAAKVPLVGAPTLKMYETQVANRLIAEAKRGLPRGTPVPKEQELKLREQAKVEAAEAQPKADAVLRESMEGVDGGAVNWKGAPPLKQDVGTEIVSIISGGAITRLNAGTATHEKAYQILPDGRTRIIEIVPTGKGRRYGVFVVSEGVNKYVNPQTTRTSPSGNKVGLVSQGLKVGETGAVVKDTTIEKIKQAGKKRTLSDGLAALRAQKVTAGDTQVQTQTTAESAKEGQEAVRNIEYNRILKKEKAERLARAAREDAKGAGAEPVPTVELPQEPAESLEDLQEKEQAETAEEDATGLELVSREEERAGRGLVGEESVGYTPPPSTGPKRLQRLLENVPDAEARRAILETYSQNKAKAEKAAERLRAWAESDYNEHSTAKRGGFSEAGEMDPMLYLGQGAQNTLRGERQLSQVRSAMTEVLQNNPDADFPTLVREAKLYLATRPDLPMSQQENLDAYELAEVYHTSVAAIKSRKPSKGEGWTEAEIFEQAEIGEILVREFGMSPAGAARVAADILYGENLKALEEQATSKKLGGVVSAINSRLPHKAESDRRAEPQEGETRGIPVWPGRETELAELQKQLLADMESGEFYRRITGAMREDMEAHVSSAEAGTKVATASAEQMEQAINKALREYGPVFSEQQVAEASRMSQTLQDRIDRLEAALQEPDTLRTNFNAPPPPPEQPWIEERAEAYRVDAKLWKNARDPALYPDQLQLDLNLLSERGQNRARVTPAPKEVATESNETVFIDEISPPVEEKTTARSGKAYTKAEIDLRRGISRKTTTPLQQPATKGAYADVPMEVPGGELVQHILPEMWGEAQLRWTSSFYDMPTTPMTPEQAQAATRVTPLDKEVLEEVGADAAAAFDLYASISYAAVTTPSAPPKEGRGKVATQVMRFVNASHGGPPQVRTLTDKALGFTQLHHEQAMDLWALAKAEMTEGEWNTAKDAAITHYLQGMNRDSVANKTGYRIPEKAIPHLDGLKAEIAALGQKGVQTGAFSTPNTVAAVMGGNAYLSRSLGSTAKTREQIQARMPELVRLSEEAYPNIPEDKIDEASANTLLRAILHRLPTLSEGLGTAVYSGGELGKKNEQKKYSVRQLRVEGLADPVKLAIVSKSGAVQEILADVETLRKIVRDNQAHMQSGQDQLQSMIDGLLREHSSPTKSRGKGADYGIQQARKLLRSDAEFVRQAYRSLFRAEGGNKRTREWLKANGDAMRTHSIEEALDAAAANIPEVAGRIAEIRAEMNLNTALRDALNEITDPATVISKTVDSISETIAQTEFATTLYKMLRATGQANVGRSPPGMTGWVQLMPEGSALGEANFLALDGRKGGANGPSVTKVHQMYVPREIAQAVADITGYGRDIHNQGLGMRTFRHATSLSKYGKVVLNPLAHPRNLVSTTAIHLTRGAFGHNSVLATKIAMGTALDQSKLALGDAGRAWKEQKMTPAGKLLEKLMLSNNLMFNGGKTGALYDLRYEGFGARSSTIEYAHTGKKTVRAVTNFADTLFRLEDEAVKGHALIVYMSDYLALTGKDSSIVKKYFDGGVLSTTEQAAFDEAVAAASEQVKNTYPTFSRTPEIMKWLSRSPFFGAFPSFHSEMIRNTAHATWNNMQLIAGYMPNGAKIPLNKRAQAAALGASRLSMNAALFTGATLAANMLIKAAIDSSDDDNSAWDLLMMSLGFGSEYQRQVRGMLPFWQRNTVVGISDVDRENKTFVSVSVNYLSPFGAINDVLNGMIHSYKDAVESGVDSPEWEATKALLEGLIGTFGNTEPLFGSIYKRVRRNVSKYKQEHVVKEFANQVDKAISDALPNDIGNWAGAFLGGGIEAITPEAVNQMIKLGQLGADIMLGAPDEPEAQQLAMEVGNRAMGIGEAIGHIAGLKRRHHSFDKDWARGIALDALSFRMATTDMKLGLVDSEASDEEYYATFKQLNARRKQAFSTINENLQANRDHLGVTYLDMRRNLLDASQKFTSSGGIDFADFFMDRYSAPSADDMWKYLDGSRFNDIPTEEKVAIYNKYKVALMRSWREERE